MNKDVIVDILDYKEKFDSTLFAINDELKELKTNIQKLETGVAICHNLSETLTQQLILVERKCWKNEQYSRQECLETSGIPLPVQNVTCKTVSKIFNEWVIIKLSESKNMFGILQRKKKLKSVDIINVGLHQGSLVFINQSLCSYYKYLRSLCKRLHLKKMIHSFWVCNDSFSLKNCENTLVLLIWRNILILKDW